MADQSKPANTPSGSGGSFPILLIAVLLGVAYHILALAGDNPGPIIGTTPLHQDLMSAWQLERLARLILFVMGLRCLYLVVRRDRRLPEAFSIWLCLWLAAVVVDGLALKLVLDVPLTNQWIWAVIVGAVLCLAGVSYVNNSTSVTRTFVK